MHHTQPIRKLPSAIHQPFTMNQITFTRKETAPPPYSILLPNGQNDIAANLKHCRPYGIPTTVMHHNAPDKTQAIPLINPPNMNQQILPNNLMRYPSLSRCFRTGKNLHLCKPLCILAALITGSQAMKLCTVTGGSYCYLPSSKRETPFLYLIIFSDSHTCRYHQHSR